MSGWKTKIVDALIEHYFASKEEVKTLRLRSSVFFPDFNTVNPDEKESYLEAAEFLESKGIVELRWEKRDKGERLRTISCENFEALFTEAGKPYPKTEAENIKNILAAKVNELKNKQSNSQTEKNILLLEYFSHNFGYREIGQGFNQKIIEDFIRYLEYSYDSVKLNKITIRALSILLYNDSKRLENILSLCTPLVSRAKNNISIPDFHFPDRSYPEAMISGKLIFEYKNSNTPLINTEGVILIFPLESVQTFFGIKTVTEKPEKRVLTIENKETFYALASPQNDDTSRNLSQYDCFLFVSGYPNSAVAALIKILATSCFSFYHAGDLDPDGILILQNIQDIAQRPVTPIRMDVSTFNKYQQWARPLTKTMLSQAKKIREETRKISGLENLLERIEETGLGVEQEIIDYREETNLPYTAA